MAISTTGDNANSYLTRTEGDEYFATRPYSDSWSGAEDAAKDSALIMATRVIDTKFIFQSIKSTSSQPLQFPRLELVDRDGYYLSSTEVPRVVKEATAEMALALLKSDRLSALERPSGWVDEMDVGVKFKFGDTPPYGLIPPFVVDQLSFLLVGQTGGINVPVRRV